MLQLNKHHFPMVLTSIILHNHHCFATSLCNKSPSSFETRLNPSNATFVTNKCSTIFDAINTVGSSL
uniref:Uncharacterized protein n=1 Tax=Arundo donax TaxID=35708 RepID=A0A0A9DR68_ARUDO